MYSAIVSNYGQTVGADPASLWAISLWHIVAFPYAVVRLKAHHVKLLGALPKLHEDDVG